MGYYEAASRCAPTNTKYLKAVGDFYHSISQKTEALYCYKRASKIECNDISALQKIGKMYEELSRNDLAAKSYQHLLSIMEDIEHSKQMPEYAEANFFLAEYFKEEGDIDNFTKHINECLHCPTVKPMAIELMDNYGYVD